MDQNKIFDHLLGHVQQAYEKNPQVRAFSPFPDDLIAQPVTPISVPAANLLRQEQGFSGECSKGLTEAIRSAAEVAEWREHYRGTDLGEDFFDRFGCFPIIGEGGPFMSAHLRCWVVYMPPRLYYPWHEHHAEELYLIVSGQALFGKTGHEEQMLLPGETAFHEHSQPHATRTEAEPVLCLVFWRDDFDSAPMLSEMS